MITVVISVIQRLPERLKIRYQVTKRAKSAQPAWDAYMKAVLEGVPEQPLTPPPGIVTVKIDRSTGQLANGGNSREEYFIEGTQPTQQAVHEWVRHYR